MKILNHTSVIGRACALGLLLLLVGCATSPSSPRGEKTPLSASEKAAYQDALNNIKAGEQDKASNSLKKLTQAHPDFVGGWINLATAYYHSKKMDDAGSALENAKKLNPNLAEVYNLSGLLAVEKGEYQAAEKNYLSAIALKKDYAAAHYNLALVYDVFYQDIAKAITQYEQYLALSGNTDKATISWVNELKAKLKRKAG
ncbi:MAG TPA: tetratricopeptide repeat protein [Cellvibrio sp.]|nr:tetratricopeptide repeat protein [Cellvibrio sp.]